MTEVTAKRHVLKSASKLAQVQIVTMTLGLLTRMYMPRALGVERLGLYYFAEAFPVLFFAFLCCGIDAYIRKVVPQRPDHVKDLMFTVLVFELGLAAMIGVVLFASLRYLAYDWYTTYLVMVMGGFCAFQCIHRTILKQTFLSLHEYRMTSHLELAIKVGGTLLILGALFLWPSPTPVVWLTMLGELVGAAVLTRALMKRGWLVAKFDGRLLKAILIASLPFLATSLFSELYSNVDAAMLGRMAGNTELGFYGAATRLRGVFLMGLPIMSNSLMPIMASTFGSSRENYLVLVKDTMRLVTIGSFLFSVALITFADTATLILSGAQYLPSARIVAYLAPALPMTYLAVLIATHLTIATTGKFQAVIQSLSVGLNAVLNLYLIPYGAARWGIGGAGVGSAFASLVCQGFGLLGMLFVTRRDLNLMDRAMIRFIAVSAIPFGALLYFYDWIMAVPLLPRIAGFVPATLAYCFLSGLIQVKDVQRVLAARL